MVPEEPERRPSVKWITRERVKVDRVACPWLIRTFVDTTRSMPTVERWSGRGSPKAT